MAGRERRECRQQVIGTNPKKMDDHIVFAFSAGLAALALAVAYAGQQQPVSSTNNGRLVAVVRHGTKIEMSRRFDLPIHDFTLCQDKSIGALVEAIKSRGRPMTIAASPFVRTKQTALRLARMLGQDPSSIIVLAGLGESYTDVAWQLFKCGEQGYRVPVHTSLDPCMAQVKDPAKLAQYAEAVDEVNRAGVPLGEPLAAPPTSPWSHGALVRDTLQTLLATVPSTHDLLVVTHSGNVKHAMREFAPSQVSEWGTRTPTCGSAVFIETVPGKLELSKLLLQ